MKIDDERQLQVVIMIAPSKGNPCGRRGKIGSTVPDPPKIPRIARLMALAIKFQDTVDLGEVRDYADLARLGYVSRARITQIMNLLNLAPDIQEELLTPSPLPAEETIPERSLRHVTAVVEWSQQRTLWNELLGRGPTQH
jgi:hypothetical protein